MQPPKKTIPIHQLSVFQDFKPERVEECIRGGLAVTLKHRQVLFRAGDPATSIALVLQGALKLVKSDPHGNESIVHFASPGDTIGALLMTRKDPHYPVTCVSIGSAMVLKIPRETYLQAWAPDAVLQQRINAMLYQRMSHIQDEKLQQRRPLQVRVAALLVGLLEKYSNGADQVLPIPITRQEIADSVGSTVESVIRLMSDWTAQGILRTEDRQIEVLQIDDLIELSYGE